MSPFLRTKLDSPILTTIPPEREDMTRMTGPEETSGDFHAEHGAAGREGQHRRTGSPCLCRLAYPEGGTWTLSETVLRARVLRDSRLKSGVESSRSLWTRTPIAFPFWPGAAEANVRETIAACEYYHGLGVRAVAIVSPYYYRLSPDNVYAYFREIGRNTPVDVTLYNIPMFASPIDVPTIQRLSEECERIVAIKDSSGDVGQMMRMIEAIRPNRPDFSFMTGWDAVLMPMLMIGADGGTNVTSGVAPELTRKLYEAGKRRRRRRGSAVAVCRQADLRQATFWSRLP